MPTGPTPDLDRKAVAWAGVNTDGTPCTGRIVIRYEGPVMLDDDPDMPISVYPTKLVLPLTTRTLILQDDAGQAVTQNVGYVETQLPASNDPDVSGSGGTYLIVEDLDSGNGLSRSVVIDKDAVGTVWLNRLTSVVPHEGEPVSAVSVADLVAVRGQVAALSQSVSVLAADYVQGGLVMQDYTDTARIILPVGRRLMILGGGPDDKPGWALPGDLYAAVTV